MKRMVGLCTRELRWVMSELSFGAARLNGLHDLDVKVVSTGRSDLI